MLVIRSLVIVCLCLCAPGCYTVTLDAIPPQLVDAPIPVAAKVDVPPATANYEYVVRSLMAGGANTWTIEVGKAIVQYADAFLSPAFLKGDQVTVQIDLQSFEVHDFEAHCSVQFTVRRGDAGIFQKTYTSQGVGYAARVVWGGAFAMKSSMRRTTDEALRSVFQQFLTDAHAQSGSWQ